LNSHKPEGLAIFDHDGVLIDSLAFHQEAWVEFGRRTGLVVEPEFIRETFGMTNPAILGRLLGETPDRETVMRYSDLKEECYRAKARGRIALMAGVRELLDGLSARGILLGIGSSAVRANLELTVNEVGLAGRFASIVGLEDIQHGKPDPEVFQKAAAGAGASPERCVVFEDAPVGVRAAKTAGMLAVGVGTTHSLDALQSAGADCTVPNLVDFPVARLVEELRTRIRGDGRGQ
jgi:HAD superfamily hydrolase (TIGR01509 family)